MPSLTFSQADLSSFQRDGFVVGRQLADNATCASILSVGRDHLLRAVEPIEYEADTRYPGAPSSREAKGGNTARRLLQVFQRDQAFRGWAIDPRVTGRVKQLLDTNHIALTQAHHNSLMTKQPAFSSDTRWHRDMRYWNFEDSNLVSVWLALGTETPENGSLGFLPGTHRLVLDADRFENRAFLRSDASENQALIAKAVFPTLAAGDVVFFHAMTFHAGSRNLTDQTKYSLVFGYHRQDNHPLPGTRSAGASSIAID